MHSVLPLRAAYAFFCSREKRNTRSPTFRTSLSLMISYRLLDSSTIHPSTCFPITLPATQRSSCAVTESTHTRTQVINQQAFWVATTWTFTAAKARRTRRSLTQSARQPGSTSGRHAVSQSVCQPVSKGCSQSARQSASQSGCRSFIQSGSQSVCQPVSKGISQPGCRSFIHACMRSVSQ